MVSLLRDQRVSGIISLLYPGVSHISLVLYVDTLDARQSKISGPIPTEIGLLTSLKSMELANTQVQGTIPTEIGFLRNIRKSTFEFYFMNRSCLKLRVLSIHLHAFTVGKQRRSICMVAPSKARFPRRSLP